jgi:hypothetical protein
VRVTVTTTRGVSNARSFTVKRLNPQMGLKIAAVGPTYDSKEGA